MAKPMKMIADVDNCENSSKMEEYEIKTHIKECTMEQLSKNFPRSPTSFNHINHSNMECMRK